MDSSKKPKPQDVEIQMSRDDNLGLFEYVDALELVPGRPQPVSKSSQVDPVEESKVKISEPDSQNSVRNYIKNMNEALKLREKSERLDLKNQLKHKRISDKTYKNKRDLIEKWVDSEKKQIIDTRKILLQGWMKANEIISHLGKNKTNVAKIIDDRRSCKSPNSINNSNYSAISFCRSDNELSLLNRSQFSNGADDNLNYTSDFDI